jgi:hypothetical protein
MTLYLGEPWYEREAYSAHAPPTWVERVRAPAVKRRSGKDST